nr:succinate dehydrogenase subunit 4 [Calliblepharis sp.]
MFNLDWLLLRFSVLFMFIGILFDIEIFFIIIGFLFIHINMGIISILYDYVHVIKIKYLILFLIKVSIIEILKNIIELFF